MIGHKEEEMAVPLCLPVIEIGRVEQCAGDAGLREGNDAIPVDANANVKYRARIHPYRRVMMQAAG